MATTELKLPRLGQGMESGTIVRWLKAEGDTVKKREPLYELDTDKVTQEVESDVDGVLLEIVVAEGEVEVGSTIAMIGTDGDEPPTNRQLRTPQRPRVPPQRSRLPNSPPLTPGSRVIPSLRRPLLPATATARARRSRQRVVGSKRPHSLGGSRASAVSISRRSRGRARTAASSPRTSRKPPSGQRRPRNGRPRSRPVRSR